LHCVEQVIKLSFSVGIDLKERGSAAEMLEILPRDYNLKPIFTQKWVSVDMNCGGSTPPNPRQFQPCLAHSMTDITQAVRWQDSPLTWLVSSTWWCLTLWRPLCCHIGTAIKHPVPDWVEPSFVIFDIQALWRSGLSVSVPRCLKLHMMA